MATLFKGWVKFKVVDRKKKKRGLRMLKKGHHVRRCPIFCPKSGEDQKKERSSRPGIKFFKLHVGH